MQTAELIAQLRIQAKEIADADEPGWGNTMMDAANTLQMYVDAIEAMVRVFGPSAPTCDGCAVEIAEALKIARKLGYGDTASDGCDYCNNPLFAGRRCKNCGKVHRDAETTELTRRAPQARSPA